MTYKVLEINVDDRGRSGVYSLITSIIKNKPKDINMDIAAFENFEDASNIEKLARYRTKVKYVGYNGNKFLKQYMIYKNLLKYLKNNYYDCVHVHSDVANKLYIAGKAAKKAGISKIIFHSHASEVDGNYRKIKRILHKITRNKLKDIGTDFVACSDVAARWMYPNIDDKNIIIINNGINLDKFRYNAIIRQNIRKELNLENKLVIGHIGRFSYQKNHEYLIKIFVNLLKKNSDARLLLIGEGPDKEKIEKIVREKNIKDKVIFYGLSNHIESLLQAMDVFVLPSHFEGLPIVGVEAQAAGLPVIFSDNITKEAKLLSTTHYLPIEQRNIENWVNLIDIEAKHNRKDTYDILKRKKFDISDTMNSFLMLYRNKK